MSLERDPVADTDRGVLAGTHADENAEAETRARQS